MYYRMSKKALSSDSPFAIAAQKVEEGFLREIDCPYSFHSPFRLLLVFQMLHLAFVMPSV